MNPFQLLGTIKDVQTKMSAAEAVNVYQSSAIKTLQADLGRMQTICVIDTVLVFALAFVVVRGLLHGR